jgi:serine protease Do
MAVLAAVSLAVTSAAQAQTVNDPPKSKRVSVARITSSIPEGRSWGKLGFFCAPQIGLAWNVGRGRVNVSHFEQPAREELKQEGFVVGDDPTDPFKQEAKSDIAVGGIIRDIRGDFCAGYVVSGIYGSASMTIDWEIYSNVERRVIATVQTNGAAKSDTARTGGTETLLIGALRQNAKALIASDAFKKIIAASPADRPTGLPAETTPIRLTGAAQAQPMTIPDAVGSVVLILSGGGHGSGFLVSSDGYVMTAEHVVGSDKYVKIRWSDGLEGVGEVVRSDKRRDVALVKVDPRGRQPLALRKAAPQPGDTVFAIGAPLDVKLQSTVTRGVASANRIIDGFSFIQSDVTVNPGNSGGPLLDEKGEVLGITDWAMRERADANTGLNFFTPIGDALLFLSAEPH